MFKATDYLKLRLERIYADIIDFWEEDRGAHITNAEAVYDLTKTEDFKYILEKYGVKKAIHTYSKATYVIDGENFKEPQLLNWRKMLDIIDDVYDIEYLRILYTSGNDVIVEYLNKWFDMDSIVKFWKNENHYTINVRTSDDVISKIIQVLNENNVEDYDITWIA